MAIPLDAACYEQGGEAMTRESELLKNQIEIMGALSLLLRYAAPDLIGKAGELDRQRDELLDRHKATQAALRYPAPVSQADGVAQAKLDPFVVQQAFNDWVWKKDGSPVGAMLSHEAARLSFQAGAEWASSLPSAERRTEA